jgi:hypothetical protein
MGTVSRYLWTACTTAGSSERTIFCVRLLFLGPLCSRLTKTLFNKQRQIFRTRSLPRRHSRE